MAWNRLQDDMFACGKLGLPLNLCCAHKSFQLETTFKHDFFACTGVYFSPETDERIVLKVSRIRPFYGVPLKWLGHFLRDREFRILSALEDVDHVPKPVCTYGRNGLIYRYIEGQSLDERPLLADSFFAQLEHLLRTIHQKNVCYMDLNKRGNILVGRDGHPSIIDFQISLYLGKKWLSLLLKTLQKEDMYHLQKHKRRFRPDQMSAEEYAGSRRKSLLIRIHRCLAYPFRRCRRIVLAGLYRRGILELTVTDLRTPENNPDRFCKSGNAC
jgi:hypothetical protein